MKFSDTEFYFANPDKIINSNIFLEDDEVRHLVNVMRHKAGDNIFVTDGDGNIYLSKIINVQLKREVHLKIIEKYQVKKRFPKIKVFIPILKSTERFEFAIEKCVELGITNFVVFSAAKSHKRGFKIDRWNKIGLAAMKQSLQPYKPKIELCNSLSNYNFEDSLNIIFEQTVDSKFSDHLKRNNYDTDINLIFGPEAGLTHTDMIEIQNKVLLKLTDNRLRAETSIITAVAMLSTHFTI